MNRYNIKTTDAIDPLLAFMASNIGALTNPTKIANTFTSDAHITISRQTIDSYIKYFEELFLLRSATRYDMKDRKLLSSPFKYYFVDPGLRNATLNFRQIEPSHMMEQILYNELLQHGFAVDVGAIPIRTYEDNARVRSTLEVDFIARKGSREVYIQSAYSVLDAEKLAQELRPFSHISESFKRILVTVDSFNQGNPHYNERGVLIVHVLDFLLDLESFMA